MEIGFTFGLNISERVFWLIVILGIIWLLREIIKTQKLPK